MTKGTNKNSNNKKSFSFNNFIFNCFKNIYLIKAKIIIFFNSKKKSKNKFKTKKNLIRLNKVFYKLFFWIYLKLNIRLDFKKIYFWGEPLRKVAKIFIFKKKRKKREKTKFGIVLKISLGTLTLGIIFLAVFFYITIIKDLPNPNQLSTRQQILSTKIYARDGTLLYKIYRNQNRTLTNLEDIPDHLINATIAAEDKNFWNHHGFSIKGIMRAFNKNIQTDDYGQGGSTITQQLIKNSLLTPDKNIVRKVKELLLSIEVELMYDKDEILQMYFNEIPYGGVNYGIFEAAESYFGKKPKDLTLAESALLAGIPTAPTKYSPYGAHPEYAIYRQRYVLDRMVEDGYISSQKAEEVKNEKINLKPQDIEIKAPHFVMYVKNILEEKYGARMVEEGGLEVYTSLDPVIQELAQNAVYDEISKLFYLRVTNGAALVTNPATGEVLAMVGSYDYYDTERGGNVNLTTSLRQPGSSIKPVTYALALESGFKPSTIIDDSPVSYPDGDRRYTPVNYDGQFHGRVTLRTALASSFNIPAIKLTDKLGVSNVISFGEKLGIKTWQDRSRFGLSISLGGGEIRMVDMAEVYGVFANNGLKVKLNPILQVKDSKGEILNDFYCNKGKDFMEEISEKGEKLFCESKAVLSPIVSWQISDILSDNNARTPAFGPYSLLKIDGHQVAVKTGTTNDKRDNWTIGYTPSFVTVIWVGNNDNTPMSAVASGITGATPIWHNIMTELVKNDEANVFDTPKGLIAVQICADNGLLPCVGCKQVKTEYFIPGTEPKNHCVVSPSPSPVN